MMNLYNVSDYSTPEEFLLSFAKRFGLLGKKGVPDILKAARALVQDWNRYSTNSYIRALFVGLELSSNYLMLILEEKYAFTLSHQKIIQMITPVPRLLPIIQKTSMYQN